MKSRMFTFLLFASALAFMSCGNAEYDKAIADADALYAKTDYVGAKTQYTKALEILPDEEYPKTQLEKVNAFLAEMAKKKAIEDEKIYTSLIEKADKLFANKDLQVSKEVYKNAVNIKPTEEYPKNRITEINKILAEEEAMKNYPYHIIVGCFEVDKNAERYLQKMQSNYSTNARSIPLRGGRMEAITYKSYKTMSDAYNDLAKGKEISPEAWVMRR